ncbi:MAG: DUF362 domain-containing protein [Polyangiaceae bacterium]|jgi:hypothetical protein|nr:DUF362 domain-containing protein [Polyangiaceae bacterium]
MSEERSSSSVSRRRFLGTAASASAASAALLSSAPAGAKTQDDPAMRPPLAAKPPANFTPFAAPGRIVKVSKGNTLQPNGLWPLEGPAKMMLERAMTELTGETDLVRALGKIFHKDDKVAIKVNGIGGQKGATMGTNKELVLPLAQALLALGLPAQNVWVYEQYTGFLAGTRVNDKNLPGGVKSYVHGNGTTTMDEIRVDGIPTKFTKYLTDATAVINVSLIKDHGICGYTGMLKNMTHGSTINPHDFHAHNASPQIAHLYAQDVIKSRVRLCVTDGFKVMYDGGPLDKKPECRIPHEAVYVTTDAVAMDAFGADLVDKMRVEKKLRTLKDAKRDASYIRVAAELGLGVGDLKALRVKEVAL